MRRRRELLLVGNDASASFVSVGMTLGPAIADLSAGVAPYVGASNKEHPLWPARLASRPGVLAVGEATVDRVREFTVRAKMEALTALGGEAMADAIYAEGFHEASLKKCSSAERCRLMYSSEFMACKSPNLCRFILSSNTSLHIS